MPAQRVAMLKNSLQATCSSTERSSASCTRDDHPRIIMRTSQTYDVGDLRCVSSSSREASLRALSYSFAVRVLHKGPRPVLQIALDNIKVVY